MTCQRDRKAMLAKVHIAKKDLALMDDCYRAVVSRIAHGRTDSAGKLSDGELNDLLREFKRLGWSASKGVPRSAARDPQAQKIRALWFALADAGIVHNRSETALRGYVQRMTGASDLRFCSSVEKRRLIETLKQWGLRTDQTI